MELVPTAPEQHHGFTWILETEYSTPGELERIKQIPGSFLRSVTFIADGDSVSEAPKMQHCSEWNERLPTLFTPTRNVRVWT